MKMIDKLNMLTEKQVLALVPFKRGAWLRGVKRGVFPEPKYYGKLKYWDRDAIEKLLREGTK